MATVVTVSTVLPNASTATGSQTFANDALARETLKYYAEATGLDIGAATPQQIIQHVIGVWTQTARHVAVEHLTAKKRAAAAPEADAALGLGAGQ